MTTTSRSETCRDVTIAADRASLTGALHVPRDARAVVLFAHGSGSSRSSPRNRYVAERLYQRGIGTLLFDLLTEAESWERKNVFDVRLLADRLAAATCWATEELPHQVRLGYFGASTGAAAALVAATDLPRIGAIVSRGGRPDLADPALARVTAPTLLIVGGADLAVLQLNRSALNALGGIRRLEVVPGATHLFEEPGALATVADLAADWFARYLVPISGAYRKP